MRVYLPRLILLAADRRLGSYRGSGDAFVFAVPWLGRYLGTTTRLTDNVEKPLLTKDSDGGDFAAYWEKMTRLERLGCWFTQVELPSDHVRQAMMNMHRSCSENIQHQDFYRVCSMPDTFQSWYTVVHFHIFLCLQRLAYEGKIAKKYALPFLIQALWSETERRIIAFGKEVPGVRKSKALQEFYDQHLAMCNTYEQGINTDDQTLARVLFTNLFVDKRKVKISNLALMVDYTRKSMLMLDELSRLHLLTDGTVSFPPLLTEADQAKHR